MFQTEPCAAWGFIKIRGVSRYDFQGRGVKGRVSSGWVGGCCLPCSGRGWGVLLSCVTKQILQAGKGRSSGAFAFYVDMATMLEFKKHSFLLPTQ